MKTKEPESKQPGAMAKFMLNNPYTTGAIGLSMILISAATGGFGFFAGIVAGSSASALGGALGSIIALTVYRQYNKYKKEFPNFKNSKNNGNSKQNFVAEQKAVKQNQYNIAPEVNLRSNFLQNTSQQKQYNAAGINLNSNVLNSPAENRINKNNKSSYQVSQDMSRFISNGDLIGVTDNGNCFYEALATSLGDADHINVKDKIMEHLKNKEWSEGDYVSLAAAYGKTNYKGHISEQDEEIFNFPDSTSQEEKKQRALDYYSTDKNFADNLTVNNAAEALGKNIIMFKPGGVQVFHPSTKTDDFCKIYFHSGNAHYDSVRNDNESLNDLCKGILDNTQSYMYDTNNKLKVGKGNDKSFTVSDLDILSAALVSSESKTPPPKHVYNHSQRNSRNLS